MAEAYQQLQVIGKGSFGKVTKIRRIADNQVLVHKEMNYGIMSEKEKQQIVSEVNILRELNHPNIVKYVDRYIDKKNLKIFVVMEYCSNGDLQQVIKRCQKTKDHIAEDFIWKILAQICSALYFCHRRRDSAQINTGNAQQKNGNNPQKILHRDLKPGNIFLDKNSDAKVGDFGLARIMNSDSTFAQTHVGTPYYMSPELINEQKYNEKSDIWSLGCIVYEMAALRPPFQATNSLSLAMKIQEAKFDRIPSTYSEELWRVITWMLTLSTESRANIDELIDLPQITRHFGSSNQNLNASSPQSNSLRQSEQKLKEREQECQQREQYLKQKEQFLNQKEEELLQREKDLNLAVSLKHKEIELNEKERLLHEILKTKDLPRSLSDLQATLLQMERSQTTAYSSNNGLKDSTEKRSGHNLKEHSAVLLASFSPQKSPQLSYNQNQNDTTLLSNYKSDPSIKTFNQRLSKNKLRKEANSDQKASLLTGSAGSSDAITNGLCKQEKKSIQSPIELLKQFQRQKLQANTSIEDDADMTFIETEITPTSSNCEQNPTKLLDKPNKEQINNTNYLKNFMDKHMKKTKTGARNQNLNNTMQQLSEQTVKPPRKISLNQTMDKRVSTNSNHQTKQQQQQLIKTMSLDFLSNRNSNCANSSQKVKNDTNQRQNGSQSRPIANQIPQTDRTSDQKHKRQNTSHSGSNRCNLMEQFMAANPMNQQLQTHRKSSNIKKQTTNTSFKLNLDSVESSITSSAQLEQLLMRKIPQSTRASSSSGQTAASKHNNFLLSSNKQMPSGASGQQFKQVKRVSNGAAMVPKPQAPKPRKI